VAYKNLTRDFFFYIINKIIGSENQIKKRFFFKKKLNFA